MKTCPYCTNQQAAGLTCARCGNAVMDSHPKPCHCPAYRFPHRKNSGKCREETRDPQPDEEAADRWLSRMINPYRHDARAARQK